TTSVMYLVGYPTNGSAACCAPAASGHAAAAPPSSVMNSRRLMGATPQPEGSHPIASQCRVVHHSKIDRRMAETGQTEKSRQRDGTAGLPSTADIFDEYRHGPLSARTGHGPLPRAC